MAHEISLGEYPEDTDLVIVATHPESYNDQVDCVSMKQIADVTGLSKDQVRYRVEKLVDDDHMDRHTSVMENNHPDTFSLKGAAKNHAKTIIRSREILGRYPDEPTKEDYLNLVKHIRGLEAKIEQHTMEYERMAELIRY